MKAPLFKSLRHNRKLRLAATPIIVVGAAFAVTVVAQAATDSTDPILPDSKSNSSVQPSTKQESKPMQDDSTDKKSQESVQDDGSGSTTNVTVNGETIAVPENGNYHRSTVDGDTQTEIDVNSNNHSTTNGNGASNSSSTNITVDTRSNSTSESSSR